MNIQQLAEKNNELMKRLHRRASIIDGGIYNILRAHGVGPKRSRSIALELQWTNPLTAHPKREKTVR